MKKPKPSSRGGKRKGAGRKSEGKKHYNVTLTEKNVNAAKKRTDNLSGTLDELLAGWLN